MLTIVFVIVNPKCGYPDSLENKTIFRVRQRQNLLLNFYSRAFDFGTLSIKYFR